MSHCVTEKKRLATECPAEAAGQPRSLYYGWVMLPMAMAAMIASSPGQTYGISVFNEPIRLALGLSHGGLAAAYMLGTLLGAVPIVYIGYQMDRHGLRRTMLTVITLFSLACLLTSFVQGWVTLVAAFCLLRMLGPGALSFLSGNVLPFWFDRRLGTVEGMRQLGTATAIAVVPLLHLWLINQWGWRGAYAVLGVGIWLVLFPAVVVLFRNRPGDLGQWMDNRRPCRALPEERGADVYWGFTLGQTLRMPTFWIVACSAALLGLIHTGVFFCVVPIVQERGLTAGDAAAMLTLFAVALAMMQLPAGMLADRIQARWLLLAGMAGLSTAVATLWLSESRIGALAAGAGFGASQAVVFGAANPLWARYFGRLHLGKIRGVLMTLNVALSSLGPLLVGVTRDWRGDFNFALVVFVLAPMPLAALALFVAPPRREVLDVAPALARPTEKLVAVEGLEVIAKPLAT